MKRLQTLQRDFQAHLLKDDDGIAAGIVAASAEERNRRLDVYREAYRLRLLEAFEGDFTVLRAYLGEHGFSELARAYIAAHPSDHPSLRHFGRHLPGFLTNVESFGRTPLLAELAAFEWALIEAFDAADRATVALDDMARVPADAWPTVRFELHPSLRKLELRWNAPAIWKSAKANEPLPSAEQTPAALAWAVWRQDLQTFFRSLAPPETWALDAVRAHANFGEVCEGLCEWIAPEEVAAFAAGLLKQWLADGWIAELHLN